MKNQFKITGRYYTINEFKFRDVLNIKKKTSKLLQPDIMVIMMNPGGSKPLNGDEVSGIETLAKPDKTQDQIMSVMLNCNFEYARVLNLSDLREPKSSDFIEEIIKMDSQGITHSIFHKARINDLNKLWVKNVPVIFGWGVHYKLKPLALKALSFCNFSNPIGIQKPKYPWAFYHPLPRGANKQKEWVEKISKLF
jgi:hypothetical protein